MGVWDAAGGFSLQEDSMRAHRNPWLSGFMQPSILSTRGISGSEETNYSSIFKLVYTP